MRFCLILLLMGSSVVGQSRAVGSSVCAAVADSSLPVYDETWDPASLFEVKLDSLPAPVDLFTPDQYDVLLKGQNKKEESAAEFSSGYRVQLLSTRNEAEARAGMQDALAAFSDRVYLLYDSPCYKLRVGDCLQRAEADSLQQRALQKGFSSAWIIRSQVYTHPPNRQESSSDPALVLPPSP